jgi:hypothetical protein
MVVAKAIKGLVARFANSILILPDALIAHVTASNAHVCPVYRSVCDVRMTTGPVSIAHTHIYADINRYRID